MHKPVVLAFAIALAGCSHKAGGGDMQSTVMDMNASVTDSGTVKPTGDGGCSTGGESCLDDTTCCSGHCDPVAHLCTLASCMQPGATCASATDCCNLNCVGGVCATTQCIADNQACTAGGAECCSTMCVSGKCQPLNTMCKTAGNTCTGNDECCDKTCTGGVCAPPSTVSYCTQVGDICFADNQCCTGVCTIASGASAGTCAAINAPCNVDGTVCSGCTGCCSSFCAPFGTSPTHICQPAGGCHVLGDLCLQDGDCCGGDAKSGLPGAGEVVCLPDPNHPQIGTCSMANVNYCPMPTPSTCHNTCQPEGDVCHFKNNGGCPSNSFPDNCCGAPGNKGMCQLDVHGVPRCHGIGACVMPGGTCASTGDCCNNTPCVPGPGGTFVCGAACVPQGQTCTATTDCCSGFVCVVPPGATNGTCINPTPPPTAPADMAGTNGVFDLSTPPPTCSLVDQSCSTTQPCCAGNGSCTSTSTGQACAAGATDCICALPIQ